MFGFGKKQEDQAIAYPRAILDQEEAFDFLEWLAQDRERALKAFEDTEQAEEQPRRRFLGLF